MKKYFLFTFLALSLFLHKATAGSATFGYFCYQGNDDYYNNVSLGDGQCYNPILCGWYSDPSICRVGEDYFMVASTFCYYPGVPIFHSRDLVNWQQIGNVLNRPSQLPYLSGQDYGKGGIYAATIRYNKHNKLFYLITTDVGALPFANGRGAGGMARGSHFYVTTDNPFSNRWSDPLWLPDIGGIDPDLFFDDDGSAYIIHKEDVEGQPKWNNHRALRIIRFDPVTGKTFGEDKFFVEEGVGRDERLDRDEGPHIYKVKGKYYIVCAEGGTSVNHSAVVYRSDSVMGTYTRWPRNPMLTQRNVKGEYPTQVTCTGHVDMVETAAGNWWAVFLGCRPGVDGVEQMGRETFLMPVKWSDDGFPYITQCQDTIPLTLTIDGTKREDTVLSGNFEWRDDFDGKTMRPEWLSMWGSAEEFFTIRHGQLTMKPSATLPRHQKPLSYIGRRIQHHKFACETELTFTPDKGEIAGLTVMRNEDRHYIFGLRLADDGSLQIALVKARGKGYTTINAKAIDTQKNIKIKAVCHGNNYDFSYSTDGNRWTTLATDIDAFYTSQRAGGFIGTTVGISVLRIEQ